LARRLLNLLTTLSLLLCVAVCALWVRSYRGCDVLVAPRRAGDRLCVTSEFGVFAVEAEGELRGSPRTGWEYFASPLPRRWPVRRRAGGFDVYQDSVTHYVRLPPTPVRGVTVPHWFVLLAGMALPAWRFGRVRRRSVAAARAASGLCTRCGYDLRATPNQCPECGAEPATGPFGSAANRGWHAARHVV
jgi:hypothetical protein